MSSCAASCCTCFRKDSCAFATSASWPTDDAPRSCHFFFICSAQHRRQSKTDQTPKTQVTFGSAQNVVDRCRSSRGLPLSRSNSVLHPPRSLLPHEATLDNTKFLCASARSVSLCLTVLQTASFYFLKSSLRESLALSSPFHLPVSSVVLYRTAPVHLDTAPSHN